MQKMRGSLALVLVFACCFIGIIVHPAFCQEMDSLQLDKGIESTRKAYFRSYGSLWTSNTMGKKLSIAVEKAVDDETKDLLWGTAGVQVLFNQNDIISKVQDNFVYRFNKDYEEFLRILEKGFIREYENNLVSFYKTIMASNLSQLNANPMQKAYVRTTAHEKLLDDGKLITEQITESLGKKQGIAVAGGSKVAGGMTLLFRRQLVRVMTKKLSKKAAGSVAKMAASRAGTIVGSYVIPSVGLVMTVWGVVDLANTFWDAPDDLKNQMEINLMNTFTEEMPNIQWEAMEGFVREGFEEAHANIILDISMAERIVNNTVVQNLTRNLPENEKIKFSERLASVARTLNISADDDNFLEEYGEIILDTPSIDFPVFLRILRENPRHLTKWYDIAKNNYYYLYKVLPSGIWGKYSPNEDSLKTLTWIAEQIPESSKQTISELAPNDINWIMNELPERYLPELLGSNIESYKIQTEITRLAQLSDKESRKPWQSKWEYWLAYYKGKIKLGVYLIVIALFSIFSLKFFRYIKGKKNSKDEKTDPKDEKTVVINNYISPSSGTSQDDRLDPRGVQRPVSPEEDPPKKGKR